MEGIDTAFIIAIVGDNLEVSVRSSGVAIDVDKIIKKIFGKENGGGKAGAGAAKINMGSFSVEGEDEKTRDEAWEFARKLWFNRIFKRNGGSQMTIIKKCSDCGKEKSVGIETSNGISTTVSTGNSSGHTVDMRCGCKDTCTKVFVNNVMVFEGKEK